MTKKLNYAKINFDVTLLGGQSFCWDKSGNNYVGFDTEKIIFFNSETNDFSGYDSKGKPIENIKNIFETYLNFRQDFSINIFKNPDIHIKTSFEHFGEIKILNQNFYEALVQFIISQNCNIKSIRYRVRMLAQKFGKKIKIKDQLYYLFPTLEELSSADLPALTSCSLGYRSKFLFDSLRKLNNERDLLNTIALMEIDSARKKLLEFNGIGEKVADCILLYGLGRYEIFPIDLWAKRILTITYKLSEKMSYLEMRNWIKDYFGESAGIAGQYLFEYARLVETRRA